MYYYKELNDVYCNRLYKKIKIRNKKNKIVSKGYFNVDNLTLKLAGLEMPASKLHITSNGTLVNLDTDLYLAENEKLTILGAKIKEE